MDIRKLQRAIVDGLEDVKAQQIAVFNTEHLSALFERVIIASGTSNRQTKALAASVRDAVKARGMQVMSTEGEDNGEWIIVDCGAAVAHIMQPAIRDYYHLEEIWGGKAVRMKVGAAQVGLVKASEPEPEPAILSRRSGRPAADGMTPARRAAAGQADAPAPASKSAAKKKAPAKSPSAQRPVARPTAAEKAVNKSAAYKRVSAKTAPRRAAAGASAKAAAPLAAGRSPARNSPARKPVAGKPAAGSPGTGKPPRPR